MSGTKIGGKKAAATNKARDPQFYAKIGAKGGRNGHTGGFASDPERARIAGQKGGFTSTRSETPILTLEQRRLRTEEILKEIRALKDLETYEQS